MLGQFPPLIERGLTFWVDFTPEARGHEQEGVRPAVVVSAKEMSAAGILIVAPTTTQKLDRVYPYEVRIPAGRGVPQDSKALVNQLRTIDINQRLRGSIGRLDDDLMAEIDRALLIVLFGPEFFA
jgi:mRNA interferase MazF